MDKIFGMKIRVPSYDLDQNRRLRISSIFKYMQEAAGCHLDQDNETYENMRSEGIVFLLTQIGLKITRLPVYREVINCSTWFLKTKGAHFIREMMFSDKKGEKLMEAETVWIITDPLSHKVLRPNRLPFEMPQDEQKKTGVSAQKIMLPDDMPVVGRREVRNSDIDCNNHLANTVYADIICDFLPGIYENIDISEMQLGFLGEAHKGEIIEVRSCMDMDTVYFEGSTQTHRCFSAQCKIIRKTA